MGASESRIEQPVLITTRPKSAYYTPDLAAATNSNQAYRRVVYTSPNLMQLVFMSIPPGVSIPTETHTGTDQFIRIEEGQGQALIGGQTYTLRDDSAVLIPAGTEHTIYNTSATETLKLYTIYSPPEHPPESSSS